MWSYYGAKTNIIKRYPRPLEKKIIEPFAGTGRYSLEYFDHEILLVDRYPVITGIFNWLKLCSAADILRLPRSMAPGQTIDDFTFDCIEAKNLFGFLIVKSTERPRKSATRWVMEDRPNFINFSVQRIAANLFKIRHWKILTGSYEDIKNQKATWFIDPPYYGLPGAAYVFGSSKINYGDLGNYCLSREGQVIVCEGPGAKWLPFKDFHNSPARRGKKMELMYYQENQMAKAYQSAQLNLFL